MDQRQRYLAGAAGGTALMLSVLLLVLGVGPFAAFSRPDPPQRPTPATCDRMAVTTAMLTNAGFRPGQFVVGEDKFDLSLPAATDHGAGSFSTPLTSSNQLVSFVQSGSPQANRMVEMTNSVAGAKSHQLANPDNWVGFQLLVPSDWTGNTSFVDGSVHPAGTRQSGSGDIGWVFVNPTDCAANAQVIRVGVVRMGCGNPQFVPPSPRGAAPPTTTTVPRPSPQYRPPTPTTPPPPPTSKPPVSWECGQNHIPGDGCPPVAPQVPVQHNPCCDVGPTPNAPRTPPPLAPPTPANNRNPARPAPDPTPNGSNSGSPNGSGTPSGSTTSPGGSTTVNNPPTTTPPVDTGQGGNNGGNGSTVANPWG